MSPVQPNTAGARIGQRIKEVRDALNLNQEDFADLIGVSRNHIAAVEVGRIEPSLTAIVGILCYDIRVASVPVLKPVDPTWLLLGPQFRTTMFGERPKWFYRGLTNEERNLMADQAGAWYPDSV